MPSGTRIRSAALAGWAVLLAGCAGGRSTKETAVAPAPEPRAVVRTVNAVCPISGRPVAADAPVAMYRNVVVGFCCPVCVQPWMELDDEQKHGILRKIAPNAKLGHRRTTPRNPFR